MKNFYVNTIIIALLSIFAAVNLSAKEFKESSNLEMLFNKDVAFLQESETEV